METSTLNEILIIEVEMKFNIKLKQIQLFEYFITRTAELYILFNIKPLDEKV